VLNALTPFVATASLHEMFTISRSRITIESDE